jgi:hypothetical protein
VDADGRPSRWRWDVFRRSVICGFCRLILQKCTGRRPVSSMTQIRRALAQGGETACCLNRHVTHRPSPCGSGSASDLHVAEHDAPRQRPHQELMREPELDVTRRPEPRALIFGQHHLKGAEIVLERERSHPDDRRRDSAIEQGPSATGAGDFPTSAATASPRPRSRVPSRPVMTRHDARWLPGLPVPR